VQGHAERRLPRSDFASERQSLVDDLDVLRGQARSLVPLVVAGAFAVVLVSKGKYLKSGVKLLWKLR
jgi:hypothetical protein